LFSEKRLTANRQRATRINKPGVDFLEQFAAELLAERLAATNRKFSTAVDMFSRFHCVTAILSKSDKVSNLVSLKLPGDGPDEPAADNPGTTRLSGSFGPLPFDLESINLVTSTFGMHWCNDLPGMFAQVHKILAPDGLFLCVLPGDRTLFELRECLLEAETNLSGSASLRVDPFGEVRQLGGLLQRAGFALPVVDTELLTVRYDSVAHLISDLRGMGANSALKSSAKFGPRNLFDEAEKLYRNRYMDPDGRIRATFELVFLSGWAPHPSQQTAMKPGSATNRLTDFL